MAQNLIDTLQWQFRLTWKLAADHHLPQLTNEACLWKPMTGSWTVHPLPDGRWSHDWSESEPSPVPTVTIGWITWHIIWWWSGLIAASKGDLPNFHDAVDWPGSAASVRDTLERLAKEWSDILSGLNDTDLERPFAYPWPEPQPLRHAIAWANSELMKNIAEIGVVHHIFENARFHEQKKEA
ncbi:MAG: DinB family protein [Opitutaceae bacterium]|jgi:hypothetical protein|nr:DinB family protein [Opitutaceae bacterium]